MTELIDHIPQYPTDILRQAAESRTLHGETGELVGNTLISKAEAVEQYGINGDIIGVIHLPAGEENQSGKQIAIVDYGEVDKTETPIFIFEGKPIKIFGNAKTRYGLFGINYTSQSQLGAYVSLGEGELNLGRNMERVNYTLGLGNDEPGNEAVSRNHLTISLDNAGKIFIKDHSSNGTYVEGLRSKIERRETNNTEPEKEIVTALGAVSLSGAGDVLDGPDNSYSAISLEAMISGANLETNGTGNYRLNEEQESKFLNILEHLGILAKHPTADDINKGIARAKRLIETGEASDELSQMSFMGEKEFGRLISDKPRARIIMPGEAYINTDLIGGSAGHDSWLGRGPKGYGEVARREAPGGIRSSIEQIKDYASRDSQLPEYDTFGLALVLTKEGPILHVSNAHRTSAAKLRKEPLRFSSLVVYDAR